MVRYLLIELTADRQTFITCSLNEREEFHVIPRSCNIGTNVIVISLILLNIGKCSVANPFRAKSMGSVLSSFIFSLLWNIHVFTFEMHCSVHLIVATKHDL